MRASDTPRRKKWAPPHPVFLGSDIYGNIYRLDYALDGLLASLTKTQETIEDAQQNLEQDKAESNKLFPFEEELDTKSVHPGELNAMLDMDKPENKIVDGERSKNDFAPTFGKYLDSNNIINRLLQA